MFRSHSVKPPSEPPLFRLARIPKRAGTYRNICIPCASYAKSLRAHLPQLEAILANADSTHSNYAFERGKNCALMALQHTGYRYTLSMDIEDFFDSVRPAHVQGLIPQEILDDCFIEESPKQGLPTSPLIATIAFLGCDAEIKHALRALKVKAIYTRYADDLVFSFNDRRELGKIKVAVHQTLQRHGFQINRRKTRLQDAANGRIIVTGIAVDSNGVHATRKTKKRIRAALHQGNESWFNGLTEWSKCKLPSALFATGENT